MFGGCAEGVEDFAEGEFEGTCRVSESCGVEIVGECCVVPFLEVGGGGRRAVCLELCVGKVCVEDIGIRDNACCMPIEAVQPGSDTFGGDSIEIVD